MRWRGHVLCWWRMMGSIMLLLRRWGRDLLLLLLRGCLMQLTGVRTILSLRCGWLRRLGCELRLCFVRRINSRPPVVCRGSAHSYHVAGSGTIGARRGWDGLRIWRGRYDLTQVWINSGLRRPLMVRAQRITTSAT